MLENSIHQEKLFVEISKLIENIGLFVVDVRKSDNRETTHVVVTITNKEHNVGIEECEKAHRLIFPRLSLLEGVRELDLEVSTPGLQRNFRDFHEFELFSGRRCRIYDSQHKSWVEGIIVRLGVDDIELSEAKYDNGKEILPTCHILHENVQKAKLAYSWEDM